MENIVTCSDYSYNEYKNIIEQLNEKYKFLSCHIIGTSCAGRNIYALKLGRTNDCALYAGAFHGSERITCTLLLMFIEQFCNALEKGVQIAGIDARRAIYEKGIIIVPLVNPDGCEIALSGKAACGAYASKIEDLCKGDFSHWNANLRGVDINHNFNAEWETLRKLEQKAGIDGPAPTRFGGYRPESEPETIALTRLCRQIHFRHALAFHSQGEVIYHSFGNKVIPRAEKMAKILSASSGYSLAVAGGLAEGGGFKDWFITEFERPAFTIEVGLGTNPLPPGDLLDIFNRLKEFLVLGIVM